MQVTVDVRASTVRRGVCEVTVSRLGRIIAAGEADRLGNWTCVALLKDGGVARRRVERAESPAKARSLCIGVTTALGLEQAGSEAVFEADAERSETWRSP